jgi:hypothetical protein
MWFPQIETYDLLQKGGSKMGVTLKIGFNGRKKDLRPFWVPVVFELKPARSKRRLLFFIKNFDRQVKDDKDRRMSFFSIPNLPPGRYALSILEFHTGHPIISGKRLQLKGKEVGFALVKDYRAPKQPNTFAMDLVADAPYRIEGSCRHFPVVVFIQDVEPGEIKISSIELYDYPSTEEFQNRKLAEDAVYRVLDTGGNPVEKNGRPAFLDYDAGKRYETVNSDPWYRIILLDKDRLPVHEGDHWGYKKARYLQYMVKIQYRRLISDSKKFILRTRVPDCDLPKVAGWQYGDTHYHSEYTRNPYEYGGPLFMTAEAAKAMGLSWVTVTDHSYCLGHPKTPEEEAQGNRWQSYQRAVKKVNDRYEDVLLVGAEEITVRRGFYGLHLLSFGNPFVEDDHPLGFGSLGLKTVLERIRQSAESNGGFLYAAHPAYPGYVWEEEDYRLASDPRYKGVFLGLQVFNEKILYQQTTQSSMDVDYLNPFAMLDESGRRSHWSKELEEGVRKHWVEKLLVPSLREFQQAGILRKFFILGGSDAHMDFNFAFRPHMAFLIHYLNDNAFGKVRTLAYLPKTNGQELSGESLYRALRNGNSLATDGPVALFSLRPKNGGKTHHLGETVPHKPGEDLELSMEWKSTPEFGPVDKISLYLGTTRGERDITEQVCPPRSRKKGYEFEGSIERVLSKWETIPCYLRLEAGSGIDPESGETLFRCVTNPIWVVAG